MAYNSGAARPPSTPALPRRPRAGPVARSSFLTMKRECPGRTAAGAFGGFLVYQQRQLAASRVNGNLLVQCAAAACDRMLAQGGALPPDPECCRKTARPSAARSFLFR